ncbi:MAG: hypothetical protein JSS54_10910 [Proteobacteria bacterium]|nr:hypothetical protein [Pseudomonadota bacterium]
MKLVDQYPIFELGGALRHLRDLTEDTPSPEAFDQLFGLWTAGNLLGKAIEGDPPLRFCRAAAMDLLGEIRRKQQQIGSSSGAEGEGKMQPLAGWQLVDLKNKIDIFEHQLRAELSRTASYAVPERGIFNIELLAENAERHIHESIRLYLSEFAIAEYREAGRCLAFGLYSASGFHSARAVEDELRTYYERFLGPPPEQTMGQLAGHLSDLQKSKDVRLKPRENTVRHIKDLTNFDRNPLMHRRVVLNEVDATTLFNNALGVIVEMVKELIALDDADLQEALPLSAAADLGLIPEKSKRRPAPIRQTKQISDGSETAD